MNRPKYKGLVADLLPNIRIMQYSGLFIFNYHDEYSSSMHAMRILYAMVHFCLVLGQILCLIAHLSFGDQGMHDYLSADTVTVLFFTHCVIKYVYFAALSDEFYRTLAVWNRPDHHPLYLESNNRYRSAALKKMRQLLHLISFLTIFSIICWVGITFMGDSTRTFLNPENKNETITIEIPRYPVVTYYPIKSESNFTYYVIFGVQVYWVIVSLVHENSLDVMFCSWLIFASEQIKHLKEILNPLIQLSSSLDTYVPNSADLFHKAEKRDLDLKGVYNTRIDLGEEFRRQEYEIDASEGVGPNNLSRKQELIVRSAIKYWVERHKHTVRLVDAIGETYGLALLLHMLISTIALTLLAYQATKINGINPPSLATIGYLLYALGQVYHFCVFGNRLIEESSSMLDSAYNSGWYNGSEEAKTFIQIVCQQTQRSLSISGAKFFTVSLDLFASVLGAVVTYFMVLIQLN